MSTAQEVRDHIDWRPVRSFITAGEIPGPRRAVECEMFRLASKGEVIRVRKGLYWKGPSTRVGMPLPRAYDIALEVAGPGAGPAELSAAHVLGLTTQVPAFEVVAVPGRCPAPVDGIRFVSRSIERRFGALRPLEVAVLEVFRQGPAVVEGPWSKVRRCVSSLAEQDGIRVEMIAEQVAIEHHVGVRERWSVLADSLGPPATDRHLSGQSTARCERNVK
ncbi:hypothetical protein [Gemmatimonas sp.]|uniref:hypothetical protein n=1 Tax=Gemmatimonas sp. TaxID=1962908 RepID=UPI00356998BD